MIPVVTVPVRPRGEPIAITKSPTAKAGEIFEIPVSATDCPTDRIFLVGIGDQSGAALRAAGASVGRKVRGKNLSVYSACAVKEVKAHAISMALGAWVWNLKTDKKKEEPTLLVGSKDKKVIEDAAAIAQAMCLANDETEIFRVMTQHN